MRTIFDIFFKIGDKITNNDIEKKADWDYYLLWVIFVAFFVIFVNYIVLFIKFHKISYVGWALVMLGILYFQYWGLKASYDMRKIIKNDKGQNNELNNNKIESKEEMLKQFKK